MYDYFMLFIFFLYGHLIMYNVFMAGVWGMGGSVCVFLCSV